MPVPSPARVWLSQEATEWWWLGSSPKSVGPDYGDDPPDFSPRPAPSRLYLQALRIDVDDPITAVAFTQRHGLLVPLRRSWRDIDETPGEYWETVRSFAAARGRGATLESWLFDDPSRDCFHVDEFTVRLRRIRYLARHLIAWRKGDYVRDVWPNCATDDEAWNTFAYVTDLALRPFHVRVELHHDNAARSHVPLPSLYSILVLQIVNDMADEVEFHICQAEDCRNVFVHQEGRSRGAKHRTSGVLYCSTRCMNRQVQRRNRRRAKEGQ